MAVTEFQRTILSLIAENGKSLGISYVAGGIALNQLIKSPRISRDIDVFHDTEEAVYSAWSIDKEQLTSHGYGVEEINRLSFETPVSEPYKLGAYWRSILEEAGQIIDLLPPEQAGTCVLNTEGNLFKGNPAAPAEAIHAQKLYFHRGSLQGAYPKLYFPENP